MKKFILFLAFAIVGTFTVNAQHDAGMMKKEATKTIALEQTPGVFTQQGLTVAAGSYVFEVANNNVGQDVGLVVVPKGKDASDASNHIKEAYVTQVVGNNKTETSKVVTLTPGEYVYFCPMNKTPQYTLTVK